MDIVITSWPGEIFLYLQSLPMMVYVIMLGLGFMFIGFWVRSPFIYLAVLCCMLTVVFSGDFDDYVWILGALILVSVWAVLAAVKTIMAGRSA